MDFKETVYQQDEEFKTVHVINKFGDGMIFKYDATGMCYSMLTVGNPCASQVRRLIEKYDNHE